MEQTALLYGKALILLVIVLALLVGVLKLLGKLLPQLAEPHRYGAAKKSDKNSVFSSFVTQFQSFKSENNTDETAETVVEIDNDPTIRILDRTSPMPGHTLLSLEWHGQELLVALNPQASTVLALKKVQDDTGEKNSSSIEGD